MNASGKAELTNGSVTSTTHDGIALTDVGTTLTTKGTAINAALGTGVAIANGATASLTNTNVDAGIHGATINSATATTLAVSGGLLKSAEAAISAEVGTHALTLSNGAQLQADNNRLIEVLDGAGLAATIDGSDLAGTLFAAPTGALDVTMRNAATFTGDVMHGNAFDIGSGSTWFLAGDSSVQSLALAGDLDFAEPGGGMYRTLTVRGDYAGNGGTLTLNTHLAADNAGTDRLIVEGATSGNTNLAIRNAGGAGAATSADGIQVVRVDGASVGTFALSGRAVGGAYEYALFQGGIADPNDGDWYLRSQLTPPPVDPPPVDPPPVDPPPVDPPPVDPPPVDPPPVDPPPVDPPPVDPPPVDPPPVDPPPVDPNPIDPIAPIPVYRPETGVYLANQAMAATMFRHRRDDRGLQRTDDQRNGDLWVRATGATLDGRAGEGQIDIDADTYGIELGSQFWSWSVGAGALSIGGIVAKAEADTHDVSRATHYRALGTVKGKAATLFAGWRADAAQHRGASLDAWVQQGDYDHTVHGEGLAPEAYTSRTWTASIEGAYTFALHTASNGAALYFEPQLQVLVTDYDMDRHTEVNGTVVAPFEDGGATTRAGLRMFGVAGNMQPFVELNAWHSDKGNALRFDDAVVHLVQDHTVYEGSAGVAVQFGRAWSAWSSLGVQHANSGQAIQGQVGLKLHW